jgi:plastocyanin
MSMPADVSSLTTSGDSTTSNGGTATSAVTAENISFDTERLDFSTNGRLMIHFINAASSAISHNVAIYEDETASGHIPGQDHPGDSEVNYTFDTSKPGQYFFAAIRIRYEWDGRL